MKLRKVTDFIRLEDGNIGRKAAVVTGALLASTLLGATLTAQVEKAEAWYNYGCEPDEIHRNNFYHTDNPHTNHSNHSDFCFY